MIDIDAITESLETVQEEIIALEDYMSEGKVELFCLGRELLDLKFELLKAEILEEINT